MDRQNRFGILIALFIFFMLMLFFNEYSTDDAFISYRYAENLASGHGLVYNIDQAPVEGYTNFLWTIMLAAISVVKLPVPASASFLSIFFTIGWMILLGVWANRQRVFTPHFSIAIPLILTACFPSIALWSGTGMETAFFTFLLVAGTLFISIEERKEWLGILSGLSFALAALTRPEGLLLGGMIILLSYIESKEWSMRVLPFTIRMLIFLLPPVLHALWRKSYYGHWLPNTFYAKTADGSQLVEPGIRYFMDFLIQGGLILLILTILALFIRPRIEGLWTIIITCSVYCTYVIWVGGDWMPANRLFIPILPFLVMGATAFIVKSVDAGPNFARILLLLICLHILYHGINAQSAFMQHSILSQKLFNDDPPVDVLKELGLHLREIASPYDVLAVVPAGKVPFYSRLRTIDMRGLCDAHISRQPIPEDLTHHLPGHLRRDPDYVLSKKPDFVVFSGAIAKDSVNSKDLTIRGNMPVLDEWSMLKMPEFLANYREIRVPLPLGDKDLLFYKRIKAENRSGPLLKFPEGIDSDQIIERVEPSRETSRKEPVPAP